MTIEKPPINILLVDDEVRNLDALESFLQSSDYNLVRALSAQKALLLLLEGDFAAIVLDVQMPTMSGIELANLIKQRKRTQHIPIIFLTAHLLEDKDILQGYNIGAVDYLTKPINPQILKSKIGVFVDLFRKTHALAATNAALEQEITQRQAAEEALRVANNDLEARVNARTADLSRVNEALRASEAEAMAASRAKDNFLATLSHELRTPLSPVLLLATEAASNTALPPQIRADFSTIAQNVALEARLIDDLLDLTGIARGKVVLHTRICEAHDILKEAVTLVRPDIDQKKLRLVLRVSAPLSTVLADEVRLKQVFWNVLRNAAKFTPTGGQVTVETVLADNGRELVTRIQDTGLGMTDDELGRIFKAFAQGDHATQDGAHRFGGLGLGLAISRMMMELHSGSITATSAGRGQGTTFVIKLPVAKASAAAKRPDSTPPTTPPFERREGWPRRILLVEDHKATAQVLANLLTARHYQVMSAGSVAEARELAGRENFDLLVSDIGLPDGDGYQLMAELRSQRRKLVGIALTGYGMQEDVQRSQNAGFSTHLTKPVSVHALDQALAIVRGQAQGSGVSSS